MTASSDYWSLLVGPPCSSVGHCI